MCDMLVGAVGGRDAEIGLWGFDPDRQICVRSVLLGYRKCSARVGDGVYRLV